MIVTVGNVRIILMLICCFCRVTPRCRLISNRTIICKMTRLSAFETYHIRIGVCLISVKIGVVVGMVIGKIGRVVIKTGRDLRVCACIELVI